MVTDSQKKKKKKKQNKKQSMVTNNCMDKTIAWNICHSLGKTGI